MVEFAALVGAAILGLALVAPQYVAIMQGDYDRALACLIESMTLLRPRGDKWILATVLYNVCEVLTLQGQHERAVEAGREGVACTNETGDRRSLTWCLGGLATVTPADSAHRRCMAVRLKPGPYGSSRVSQWRMLSRNVWLSFPATFIPILFSVTRPCASVNRMT
jgi:hypothetical protein